MRLAILLTSFSLFSLFGQTSQQKKFDYLTTNDDCDNIRKEFKTKLKEITWDEEGKSKGKLISDDFFNKYLKDVKEFKTKNEYLDLYYHSTPDIQSEKCYVIIKAVFKLDEYSYNYYLVDIGQKSKVIFELAALEDYPDGQRRITSKFQDDEYLIKTKVTDYIGDHDDKTDKYEIITDSLILTYKLQNNEFLLVERDSTRTIKK